MAAVVAGPAALVGGDGAEVGGAVDGAVVDAVVVEGAVVDAVVDVEPDPAGGRVVVDDDGTEDDPDPGLDVTVRTAP